MNIEERIQQIKRLASLNELGSMRKNVEDRHGLTNEVERAFRDREFELYEHKTATTINRSLEDITPVERKIISGLAALWMTHDKGLRPSRSIQAVGNRNGNLIKFAEDVVSNGAESSGYRRLKAAGFDDLVFERVVLEHPEIFSQKARAHAQRRLDQLERTSGDEIVQTSLDDPFSTKAMLEAIGFVKPKPTAWYALRGDQIAFMSWVNEADFERGIARILADEGDTGPNSMTRVRRSSKSGPVTTVPRMLCSDTKAPTMQMSRSAQNCDFMR